MEEKNYRKGVGAFLLNKQLKVFIAKRLNLKQAWQLPQGGIEPHETPKEALFRELLEEIGTNKVKILTELPPLRYTFPLKVQQKFFHNRYLGQEIIWFALIFEDLDSNINLNYTDHPEFSEWKWEEPHKIVPLIVNFKKDMYLQILYYMKLQNIL